MGSYVPLLATAYNGVLYFGSTKLLTEQTK